MFADRLTTEQLFDGFVSSKNWRPLPRIDDRSAWEGVRQDPRRITAVAAILRLADQCLDAEIDPLTGTMYMSFMRDGVRGAYDENFYRRRTQLSHLVMAECLTNRGTYLDRIIDYIWAILGEPFWCIPAHNFAGQHEMVTFKAANQWKADDPLPVPDDEYLDLFNCETAAILAEACYLLEPLMMETVPSLFHLVHQHIEQRTFAKLEGTKLYGWYSGKNNWTAWCSHNLLIAACYVIEDKCRLISFAEKLLLPMSRFFEEVEDSGSCIEGPSYWVVSAGRLIGFADLLESRFGVELDLRNNSKLRAFGEHIHKLHIGEDRYVNFADGTLRVDLDHGLLGRYAERIGSETLLRLVSDDVERVSQRWLARNISDRGCPDYARQVLIHLSRLLMWIPDTAPTQAPRYHKSVWLEDMQMMIARESEAAGKGLMLSCIAGSNDPRVNHHSHNDIGQFSVNLDGEPVIIDLGQGTYSRATFSASRYELWHISSEGHNVPQINGTLQRADAGVEARDVRYARAGETSVLSFDATQAYFEDTEGRTIRRQIVFNHAEPEIRIADEIDIMEGLSAFELPLQVSEREIVVEGDVCRISAAGGSLLIEPHSLRLDRIEQVELEDRKHRGIWGKTVRRLIYRAASLSALRFSLTIRLVRH